MRTISPAGLAKLQQQYGLEPINIIEVDWNGSPRSYADKTINAQIPGKILQLGELDNVVDVNRSSSSQSINVVLDDTDGTLKAIMDTTEIHQINARVYQYFSGMSLSDKFLIFAGKVSSPINWSEADRTLIFDIVSQIEDLEFGFSPEEGEISGLPAEMVGKPWPVIFGTCVDVPAAKITKAVTGTSMCGVGILSGQAAHLGAPIGNFDCGFWIGLLNAERQREIAHLAANRWAEIDPARAQVLEDKAASIAMQIDSSLDRTQGQITCAQTNRQNTVNTANSQGLGCNPVRILGGEDFPQDTPLTLNIGGGLFTGTMDGQDFTITSRQHEKSESLVAQRTSRISAAACTPAANPVSYFEFFEEVPANTGMPLLPPSLGGGIDPNQQYLTRTGFHICYTSNKVPNIDRVMEHFFAPAGSRVTIEEGDFVGYVASITPGTILDVKAYKRFEAETKLVSVPQDYYTITSVNFGSFTAQFVLFDKACRLAQTRAGVMTSTSRLMVTSVRTPLRSSSGLS